jgi:hypothetical protein
MLGLAAMVSAQSTPAAPPSQSVARKPPAATAGKPAKSPFVPPPIAQAEPAAAPQTAPPPAKSNPARGRRDPFVSPIVKPAGGSGVPACTTGKRCLSVGEMVLRGIVKAQNGMIAVVENSAHKTYFLRENDPVFNGFVMKITGDTVVFKENSQDTFGRPTSREVVMKVAPSA